MNTAEAIAYRIRQLCKERGITPNGLSNLAAVPQSTIKSILNGESQIPEVSLLKSFVMLLRLLWVSFTAHLSLMRWNKKSNNITFPRQCSLSRDFSKTY